MKVNPYAWRLGSSSDENVKWPSNFKEYPKYSLKTTQLDKLLFRYLQDLISFKIEFLNLEEFNIIVLLPNLHSLKINNLDQTSNKIQSYGLGKCSLRAEFLNKKTPNSDWIAYEIKNSILRRENPVRIINHFLRLVSQFNDIKGLRIQLKGRFKAKNKTQKSIWMYGNVKLQSMRTILNYSEQLIVGKYGTSTVKVILGYN